MRLTIGRLTAFLAAAAAMAVLTSPSPGAPEAASTKVRAQEEWDDADFNQAAADNRRVVVSGKATAALTATAQAQQDFDTWGDLIQAQNYNDWLTIKNNLAWANGSLGSGNIKFLGGHNPEGIWVDGGDQHRARGAALYGQGVTAFGDEDYGTALDRFTDANSEFLVAWNLYGQAMTHYDTAKGHADTAQQTMNQYMD
jgi:hypothetical protein